MAFNQMGDAFVASVANFFHQGSHVGSRSSAGRDAVFTNAQIECLKSVFKASLETFGAAIEDHIAKETQKLHDMINALQEVGNSVNKCVTEQCEATTHREEAARRVSSRTEKRKSRRKRGKEKAAYQRGILLQLRPAKDITSNPIEPQLDKISPLLSRIDSLELAFGNWYQTSTVVAHDWQTHADPGPVYSAVPANFLAKQCSAVLFIQALWRWRPCRRKTVGFKDPTVRHESEPCSGSSALGTRNDDPLWGCDWRLLPDIAWRRIHEPFAETRSGNQDVAVVLRIPVKIDPTSIPPHLRDFAKAFGPFFNTDRIEKTLRTARAVKHGLHDPHVAPLEKGSERAYCKSVYSTLKLKLGLDSDEQVDALIKSALRI